VPFTQLSFENMKISSCLHKSTLVICLKFNLARGIKWRIRLRKMLVLISDRLAL
jgi:hypothetical protein